MKKYLLITLIISLIFTSPSFADEPDLQFEWKDKLIKDSFVVKVYKKKMSKKLFSDQICTSYLSFNIKRKIAKGKKDPQNQTLQNLVLYFSTIDESQPNKVGPFFSRMNFVWDNRKNNVNFSNVRGCADITKEDLKNPIVIWINDTSNPGPDPSFILN